MPQNSTSSPTMDTTSVVTRPKPARATPDATVTGQIVGGGRWMCSPGSGAASSSSSGSGPTGREAGSEDVARRNPSGVCIPTLLLPFVHAGLEQRAQVHDREDEYPHTVDEVPVVADTLHGRFMTGMPVSRQQQDTGQGDQSHEHVETMETGESEERT